MSKNIIFLNFKAYESTYGYGGIRLVEVAKEVANSYGVRIVCCPNSLILAQAAETGAEVFAQHTDGFKAGAFTGSITPKMLAEAKVKGSLLNHSEKRITPEQIKQAIDLLKENELESLVCCQDNTEAIKYVSFKPDFLAIEPPDLIGSGISVSKARPDLITNSVSAIREIDKNISIICGAGISNAEDVKKAFELGVDGVLIASAFVNSQNHRKFLESIIAAMD